MAARTGISEKKIEAAIRAKGGVRSLVAAEIGCTPQNLGVRIKASKVLQEAERDTVERLLDMADAIHIKALQDGDRATARWYSELKGKRRGYSRTVNTSIDDAQIEAFLASLGGDLNKYRALIRELGEDPDTL